MTTVEAEETRSGVGWDSSPVPAWLLVAIDGTGVPSYVMKNSRWRVSGVGCVSRPQSRPLGALALLAGAAAHEGPGHREAPACVGDLYNSGFGARWMEMHSKTEP